MTYDTLTYNGVEKSFVDWGIQSGSVRGRKINQAASSLSLTLLNRSIATEATTPTFPFEAQIVVQTNRTLSAGVYSGGAVKFQGKRVGQPMRAGAQGQHVSYKFEDAWYDLSNNHYNQYFKGSAGKYLIAETVLFSFQQGYYINGSQYYYGLISVGDQIQFILEGLLANYAAQGFAAPFKFKGRDHSLTPSVLSNSYGGVYYWPSVSDSTISNALYNLYLPTYITKPLMCSEAIKKCLELSPRANCWLDHSTAPPTFKVTLPADKTPKTLYLFDGTSHKSISINRRDDLLVRAVNIIYRVTKKVNNQSLIDYVSDQWGAHGSNSYWNIFATSGIAAADAAVTAGTADPITGLRVVNELIDSQGVALTTVKGHLDCEPLGYSSAQNGTAPNTPDDNLAKRQWWSSKRGGEHAKMEDTRWRFQKFDGTNIVQTYAPDARVYYSENGKDSTGADVVANQEFTAADYAFYTQRLVRGTHHAWMTLGNTGTPVLSVKAKIHAAMTYAYYDITSSAAYPDVDMTGVRHANPNSEDVHVNVELTNGVTGVYSAVSSITPGESIIIGNGGIAQYLYQHLNAYQYDGDAVHVQAAFDGTGATGVDLGCTLNLLMPTTAPDGTTNPQPWTNINAQIQSIEEDYTNHTTTIQIGVARHLNSGQLSSILNMWHNRRAWYNPAIQADNQIPSGGDVDLPITAGSADTAHGLVNHGASSNVDYSTQPSGTDGQPPSVAGVMTGQLNHDPTQITKTLAAAVAAGKTVTPIAPSSVPADPHYDIKTMQPRKCVLCDENGNQFFAMVHVSGGWTES